MSALVLFLAAHPEFWAYFLFPLITAVVTWLTKPRTAEDFAAMNPRVAAFLKLVAAVGFDAPKILDSIKQLVSGKVRTPAEEKKEK